MRLPNAELSIIAPERLRDYLLNVAHRRGGSKAKLLVAMGYAPAEWTRLETDLRDQHLTTEVSEQERTDYGMQYVVKAPLVGPTGCSVVFRSIWQIDDGTDTPRLITMYPE